MKPRICLLLVVFFLHRPLTAHAWYDKVHSYLVKLAAQIVEQKDKVSGQKLYEELYTNEFLQTKGREWLADVWRSYPVLNYGDKWDL